jgi:hypothetical protein
MANPRPYPANMLIKLLSISVKKISLFIMTGICLATSNIFGKTLLVLGSMDSSVQKAIPISRERVSQSLAFLFSDATSLSCNGVPPRFMFISIARIWNLQSMKFFHTYFKHILEKQKIQIDKYL